MIQESVAGETWNIIDLSGLTPLAVDDEFAPKPATDVFAGIGLSRGRCLGSKSGYRRINRRHFFLPNANVFCQCQGKIWWGDLDLWRDARQLEQAARRLRCRLYVVRELDGRFDNAELAFEDVRRRAIWHTGGPVCADQKLIRRSGLTDHQIASLVGISRQRVVQRQIPYIAQQINRRIIALAEVFKPLALHRGFTKWGDWLLAPHPRLQGRSPLRVMRCGGEIHFTTLEPKAEIPSLGLRLLILSATKVSLRWPCLERRRD